VLLGVEEEFFLVSTSNFFNTPLVPKALLSLIRKDRKYIYKSSIETPLARGKLPKSRGDLIKGFSLIEVKTSPHEDMESLKAELISNREALIEVAENNNLALLPVGIHPLFNIQNTGLEIVAALHIHVEKEDEKYYYNILRTIPYLIALTANSPFSDGKHTAMSSRALYSPAIGVPNNLYNRNSDLLINKSLNTVELRVPDTQVLVDDVIGAVATIKCIAQLTDVKKITQSWYATNRNDAICTAKKGIDTEELYNEIYNIAEELSLTDYVHSFFTRKTGAEWQLECFNNYGLPTLLKSLYVSMREGKYTIEESNAEINTEIKGGNNLWFLFLYSPFLMLHLIKKLRQDDPIHTTALFGQRKKEVHDIFAGN